MITVYSKNNCPNCVQAKNILKMKKIDFVEVNVEEDEAAYLFLEREGYKTLPQIYEGAELFVANGHLGLLRLMREGKLEQGESAPKENL